MKPVLPFLLALILPVSAHAYIVKAKVVDETDSPATGAVAALCTTDTAAFITAPIDEEGLFSIIYSKKRKLHCQGATDRVRSLHRTNHT